MSSTGGRAVKVHKIPNWIYTYTQKLVPIRDTKNKGIWKEKSSPCMQKG